MWGCSPQAFGQHLLRSWAVGHLLHPAAALSHPALFQTGSHILQVSELAENRHQSFALGSASSCNIPNLGGLTAETPWCCCQALGMATTGVPQRTSDHVPPQPCQCMRQRDKGAAVAWGLRWAVWPCCSPGKGLVAQPGTVAWHDRGVSVHGALVADRSLWPRAAPAVGPACVVGLCGPALQGLRAELQARASETKQPLRF